MQLIPTPAQADCIKTASEQAFRSIYAELAKKGKKVSPRGQLVIELEHYTYELPAYVRFASFAARKMKTDYVRREFLWYLRGNRSDTSIVSHAKLWGEVMNADGTINSNYGQYIFNRRTVWDKDGRMGTRSPFEYVIEELINDPDSRRASIAIFNNAHLDKPTKDVPCTYSLNFRIRNGKLNMSVHMRSQDAIFGMGNDAPCFSFIHEMVFAALETRIEGLELGTYRHTTDSFHVYERHFEMLDQIVNGDPYEYTETPYINGPDEVRHLVFDIHNRYSTGNQAWCYDIIAQPKAPVLSYELPREPDYSRFSFSNWLVEPELQSDANMRLNAEQARKPYSVLQAAVQPAATSILQN